MLSFVTFPLFHYLSTSVAASSDATIPAAVTPASVAEPIEILRFLSYRSRNSAELS